MPDLAALSARNVTEAIFFQLFNAAGLYDVGDSRKEVSNLQVEALHLHKVAMITLTEDRGTVLARIGIEFVVLIFSMDGNLIFLSRI